MLQTLRLLSHRDQTHILVYRHALPDFRPKQLLPLHDTACHTRAVGRSVSRPQTWRDTIVDQKILDTLQVLVSFRKDTDSRSISFAHVRGTIYITRYYPPLEVGAFPFHNLHPAISGGRAPGAGYCRNKRATPWHLARPWNARDPRVRLTACSESSPTTGHQHVAQIIGRLRPASYHRGSARFRVSGPSHGSL